MVWERKMSEFHKLSIKSTPGRKRLISSDLDICIDGEPNNLVRSFTLKADMNQAVTAEIETLVSECSIDGSIKTYVHLMNPAKYSWYWLRHRLGVLRYELKERREKRNSKAGATNG
jgi:hypothetical protein